MSQETTFDYNKEVVDLLFKNVIGTQYTSSELTPGQENLSLTTYQHEQIYSQPKHRQKCEVCEIAFAAACFVYKVPNIDLDHS